MPKRKPAFTLLELLTVIAILGLLISILIPSLSSARRAAKANVCLSHLKGIGNAFVVYLNENEDLFPPVQLERPRPDALLREFYVNAVGRARPRWQWFLETDFGPVINPTPFNTYIQQRGYFDESHFGRPGGKPGTHMSHELFTCPALDDDRYAFDIRDGAYGYNYQYLGNTRQDADPRRWDNFPVAQHRLRKTSDTVLAADSRGAGIRHGRHSFTLDPPRMGVEVNAGRFGPGTRTYDGNPLSGDLPAGLDPNVYAYSPAEPRHRKLANVLFVDSHARAMSLTALGYQVGDGGTPGVPRGVPLPVHDPSDPATHSASNKLWTGDGSDPDHGLAALEP